MDANDARREIKELADRLRRWQHEYYVEAKPSVEDRRYDVEMDRLIALESRFPHLRMPDSPSQRVGSDLNADFPEVEHSIMVLSLDKAYSADELLQWIEKCEQLGDMRLSFVVEQKIDGVSMVLYYEHGILQRAVTRGNGFVGNDVTANVKTIGSVPLRLPEPIDVAVRGEVYLAKSDFERLNGTLETPYANPRNLAAGTIRRIKSSETARIPLQMFVYEGFWQDNSQRMTDHVKSLAELHRLGFRVNPSFGLFSRSTSESMDRLTKAGIQGAAAGSFDDLKGYIEGATQGRSGLDYDIDGLVVKVNELDVREELGYTEHHPRWAIAYKFEAPEALTTVKAIDIQIGRTGRATPVARVESVPIGGTVVSNITLHNQDYVDMLELAIGDTVAISRRGDVIPAVERVVEKNDRGNTTWRFPPNCPSCASALVAKGAHLFCPNADCPDQVRGRLEFFAGKDQMDIGNLGPETVAFLVSKGWVRDVADMYGFDFNRLIDEKGFGEKKTALIRQGIEESKRKPYRNVLVSLGIPEFGKKAVDLLVSSNLSTIDDLLAVVDKRDSQRLLTIKGFGEKTVAALFEQLSDPVMRHRIERLRAAGLTFSEEPKQTDQNLIQVFAGQTWCVTGSFQHFQPRSLALAEIEARGGRTTSSVTGKTTHLLAGSGAGGKLEQAGKLGATIVDEAGFLRLLGREDGHA